MTAVVRRCPNCGTTQSTLGVCDACHDGEVRYFCNNHTPGRWLETSSCSQCGARFGEPVPPPRVPRFEPSPTPVRKTPTETPAPPEGIRRVKSPWRRTTAPTPHESEISTTTDHAARERMLDALARVLIRGPLGRGRGWPPTARRIPPIATPGLGCLRLIILLVIFSMFSLFGLSFLGNLALMY